MKHEDYEPTFFDNFICLRLDAFLKAVFFSLNPIYSGGDGGFLKYVSVIQLN